MGKFIFFILLAAPTAQIVLSVRRLADKTNLSIAFITLIAVISNSILSVVCDYVSEADDTVTARPHCLMPEIGLLIGGAEIAIFIGIIFGVIYHFGHKHSNNDTITRVNKVLNKYYN